jgi:hypothetical protein
MKCSKDHRHNKDCLAMLRSIEQRGSNETAKRSLGVISQVLDYAVAIGHCTINPTHSLKRHARGQTDHQPLPLHPLERAA